MNIEIKNRWTGEVIFSGDYEDFKSAVVAALKSRANLYGADLSRADLSGANLYGANLSRANLSRANLSGANLSGANLYGANLYGANLYGANLSGANLSGANLYGANLYGANLYGANLYGANLSEAKNAELAIAKTRILPAGELTVFKKARKEGGYAIVTLTIPREAKRSHAFGRKCRAEYAIVTAIDGAEEAHSDYDPSFKYRVGETVRPKMPFSENWQEECESGIHFFITREEAEEYSL